jgi:hypothetical protein
MNELARPRLDVGRMMDTHLAPFRIVLPLLQGITIVQKYEWISARDVSGNLTAFNDDYDPTRSLRALERAAEALEQLPPLANVKSAIGLIIEAVSAPASEADVRLLVGTLLDSLPAKPNESSATYIDALVWTMLDVENIDDNGKFKPDGVPPYYPIAVIAATVRSVWRDPEYRFRPSPSEVIALCDEYRRRLVNRLRDLQHLSRVIAAASEITACFAGRQALAKVEDDDEIPF